MPLSRDVSFLATVAIPVVVTSIDVTDDACYMIYVEVMKWQLCDY